MAVILQYGLLEPLWVFDFVGELYKDDVLFGVRQPIDANADAAADCLVQCRFNPIVLAAGDSCADSRQGSLPLR